MSQYPPPAGMPQNVRGAAWDALVAAIGRVNPAVVHLYPIDRETPEPWVLKVPHEVVLARAAEITDRTGVPVEPYA